MTSFQISLTPAKRAASWFIASVRRELQKALTEENRARGMTQAAIAAALGVNRSVVHRQIVGHENLTIGRVAEIAAILGREPIFTLAKPANVTSCNYFPSVPESAVGGQSPVSTIRTSDYLTRISTPQGLGGAPTQIRAP